MAPATSISSRRRLSVVNDNCALRRNVAVQPYGRCSVCTLKLNQCHAWQSSAMSFGLVILLLVPLFAHDAWMVRLAVAASLLVLVVQGMVSHKRTDELIFGQNELAPSPSTAVTTHGLPTLSRAQTKPPSHGACFAAGGLPW